MKLLPVLSPKVPAKPDEGTFRDIEIVFTRFQSPCKTCKKVVIIAGMPDRIRARVRMTDRDWEIVGNHPFFVNPQFSFHCLRTSHIVDKSVLPIQWIICDTPEWGPDANSRTGIVKVGPHFERVLSEFVPPFVEKILREQLPQQKFEYIEPPTYEQARGLEKRVLPPI